MPQGARVAVVVPTFQESGTILQLLERVRAAVPDAVIIVVDDASPDGTADIAARAKLVLGPIDVIRRATEVGVRQRVPRRLRVEPRA